MNYIIRIMGKVKNKKLKRGKLMSKDELKNIDAEFECVRNDDTLKDVTFSKEGEDKLFAQIAKYKIEKSVAREHNIDMNETEAVPQISEEDRELIELGRKTKALNQEIEERTQRYRIRRSGKMLVALAAALVMTFAMGTVSMTSKYKGLRSEATFAEEVQYRLLESEEDLIQADDVVEEIEAKQQIEKFFGQPVSWLYGRSGELKYEEISVYPEVHTVEIMYVLEGQTVIYKIRNKIHMISEVAVLEEALISEENYNLGDVEYRVLNCEDNRLMVEFTKNELQYSVITTSSVKSQILQILENSN